MVHRLTTSRNVCIPIFGICEYVISQGKRDFADVIKGKGLEMERLSCWCKVIKNFFNVEEEGRGRATEIGRERTRPFKVLDLKIKEKRGALAKECINLKNLGIALS